MLKFRMFMVVLGFLEILFTLPPFSGAVNEKEFCFDAQTQEVPLFFIMWRRRVKSLLIQTINDTTAVKQRFHLDYYHPVTKIWTTYQEDRNSKIFYLPSREKKKPTEFVLGDPFIADMARISLKQVDSPGWLGEVCVKIDIKVENHYVSSCKKGYYGGGEYCLDINECADTTGNFCPRKQHCIDYPGKFSCPGTCVGSLIANKKTKDCEDPCFHNGFICHKNAYCKDGTCVCKQGFDGDGIYCLDKCTIKGLKCDVNAYCDNGKCSCRTGYGGNGEICQAVCHFSTILCHHDAVCKHNVCRCKHGFVGDGLSKCVFSRTKYEKAKKEELFGPPRLDIVEADVFEVLHNFRRLQFVIKEEMKKKE